MPKVNIAKQNEDPLELYYSVSGVGPHKILFISGLGGIAHQWDLQVEYFASLPEFSVCIYDNRGSGFSSAPKQKYTTSMLANDAVTLLAHLEWENVHIVGLSMGGMIAQELAWRLGDKVKSLALLSTYSKFNGLPAFDNLRKNPLKLLGIVKTLASPPNPFHTPEEFAASTVIYNFPKEWLDSKSTQNGKENMTNRDVIVQFQTERFKETGLQNPAGRAGQRNACLTHYVDKRLDEIAAYSYPKIVIAGDRDELLRQPVSSLYLAKQLKAELVIYPNGGHNIRLQDPQWQNEKLLHHFRRGMTAIAKYSSMDLFRSESFESFVTAEYESEGELSLD